MKGECGVRGEDREISQVVLENSGTRRAAKGVNDMVKN